MMKAYPAYKDSGLPWVDKVPSHWETLPNIGLFDERIERGFVNDPLLSITQDRGIIQQSELQEKKDSSNEDKSAYKKVKIGDIAYNKMRMWQGAVGHSPFEGIVSPAYIVVKPKRRLNPRFYHYLFRTPAYVKYSYRNSYGICDDQLSLRFFSFKRMGSLVPPVEEQDAIVTFLEDKQREIDAFVANKQRTIALLQEQLITTIERHLTRHNDKLTVRLGYFVEMVSGFPFTSGGFTANDSDIRLLRGVNVSPGELRWNEVVRWPQAEAPKFSHYELRVGDLVLGMDRPRISTGIRVATVREMDVPALLLQRVVRLRSRPELRQGYLSLILSSRAFLAYFEPILTGISVPHISPEQVGNFRSQIPSLDVQDEVLKSVAAERCHVAEAITQARREIALMQEYRAALIAEAVTGRIDVRSQPSDGPTALDDTVASGFYCSDNAGTATGETPPQTPPTG